MSTTPFNMIDHAAELFRRQGDPRVPPGCEDVEGVNGILYKYAPNEFAAYLFLILFILTTGFHIFQAWKTKTWYWAAFIVGGLLECVGFIGRVIGAGEYPCTTLGPYIMMTLGTLLAPALFAASIYMELGRIMLLTDGSHHSLVRREWMTKIFVVGDVISIILQGAGGSMMSNKNPDTAALGRDIILAGLFVQIVFFGLFMVNSFLWWRKMVAAPTPISHQVPWFTHLAMLFFASFLIFFRSVFRVIEYIQGHDGYLMSNEEFIYVFDIVLMWAVMMAFHWYHPSEVTALHHGGKVSKGWKFYDVKGWKTSPEYDVEAHGSYTPMHDRVELN